MTFAHLQLASMSLVLSGAPLAAQQASDIEILLGPEETVFAAGTWGMVHFPDGPVSFHRTDSGIRTWFSCLNQTCELQGSTLEALSPRAVDKGRITPVLKPSGAGFDRNYAGAYSVIPAHGSSDLLMFYAAEEHPCTTHVPFKATVGLARSSNDGASWTRVGPVFTSGAPEPTGCTFGFWGPQSPNIARSRDEKYLYMYFSERVPRTRDQIYVARSPVEANGAAGTWERYSGGGWVRPGAGVYGTPVITPPTPVNETIYAGAPAVSYNRYLDRFVAVFQTMVGFYVATSKDGLVWDAGRPLLRGVTLTDQKQPIGTPWQAYPSFVSTHPPDQTTTDDSGYLYYSRGYMGGPAAGQPAPNMVRRSFTIRKTGPGGVLPIPREHSAISGSSLAQTDSIAVGASGWRVAPGGADWLRRDESDRNRSGRLRWKLSAMALTPGVYTDTVRIIGGDLADTPILIEQTLRVSAPVIQVACAATDLISQTCLSDDERRFLDLTGNRDGKFNLGDLLAFTSTGKAAAAASQGRGSTGN